MFRPLWRVESTAILASIAFCLVAAAAALGLRSVPAPLALALTAILFIAIYLLRYRRT
jgi:hypothetical protein